MKTTRLLSLALLAVPLVGCSGGSSDSAAGTSDGASFSRPLNDAEKAKMGGKSTASGPPPGAPKKGP